jgi:biopolymer transport protein ExbD
MAHISFDAEGQVDTAIPTSSMADIAFLLLIFFIVTTVFVQHRPEHPPEIPRAESVDKLKNRRNLVNMWISPEGIIQIDSALVNLDAVAPTVLKKLQNNPRMVVLIKSDIQTQYKMVSDVIEELRKANALHIAFASRDEI